MELLLALALMGLIAAGIASSLGFGIRIYERQRAAIPMEETVANRVLLRHWLSEVLPQTALAPFPYEFDGQQEALTFLTLAETPALPSAAALRVSVRCNEGTLQMEWTAIDDAGAALETEAAQLAGDLTDCRIAYRDLAGPEGSWLSEWTDRAVLPAGTRIMTGEENTAAWPDFVVRHLYAQQ